MRELGRRSERCSIRSGFADFIRFLGFAAFLFTCVKIILRLFDTRFGSLKLRTHQFRASFFGREAVYQAVELDEREFFQRLAGRCRPGLELLVQLDFACLQVLDLLLNGFLLRQQILGRLVGSEFRSGRCVVWIGGDFPLGDAHELGILGAFLGHAGGRRRSRSFCRGRHDLRQPRLGPGIRPGNEKDGQPGRGPCCAST